MRWPRRLRRSKGAGACGTGEAVELAAVTLADGSRVAIEPAATLNCAMAEGLARWVREDLAPSAARVGQPFKALKNYASYDCRGRNRNPFAMMSEHGRANAIDIRGFESVEGRWRFIDSPDMPKALMAEMKRGACERFMTVLGPGSDGYHENHIHVDLAERANGRKLCGWKMDEPLVAQGAPKGGAEEATKPSSRLATARAPLAPVKPRPPGARLRLPPGRHPGRRRGRRPTYAGRRHAGRARADRLRRLGLRGLPPRAVRAAQPDGPSLDAVICPTIDVTTMAA